MLQDFHSIRTPGLRAESSILSPLPIYGPFAVHMLQRKWDMCLIAKPHQIECRVTYIYLPIFDPSRLADTLKTMIRISSWRITAPQCRSTPSCVPHHMIQFPKPISNGSCK